MNEQTRREFLRKCFHLAGGGAAGLAAIHGLGMGAVEDARAWGILPALVGSGAGGAGNTSWATWDEVTEAGWGDSANTYICLMENLVAAGNETGQGGGLAGVDLVLTQADDVPGASGSPLSRQLVAANDRFGVTENFVAAFLADNTWTLIIKAHTITNSNGYCLDIRSADNTEIFTASGGGGTTQTLTFKHDNVVLINSATGAASPNTGAVYLFFYSDGSHIRGGWSTTKPTSWAAIAANQKVSADTASAIIDTSDGTRTVPGIAVSTLPMYVYYLLLSKSVLIGA